MISPPAMRPCGNCPYRRDTPSGLWDATEYEKLPAYDGETSAQPVSVFMCHQQNGKLCAGWVAAHDMYESLGLRIASAGGKLTKEDLDEVLAYATDVPLFESGSEACRHGLRDIDNPPLVARRMMSKLGRRRRA